MNRLPLFSFVALSVTLNQYLIFMVRLMLSILFRSPSTLLVFLWSESLVVQYLFLENSKQIVQIGAEINAKNVFNIMFQMEGAVAQSVERVTPGEEVLGSIPAVAAVSV